MTMTRLRPITADARSETGENCQQFGYRRNTTEHCLWGDFLRTIARHIPKPRISPNIMVVSPSPPPAFDPEVLGGDTCALGECCINPVGFLASRLLRYLDQKPSDDSKPKSPLPTPLPHKASFTTVAEIIYILGCYGGWAVVFLVLYPLIAESTRVSNLHRWLGVGVLTLCLFSWWLAKTSSPGSITADNLHIYDNYAYDNVLYYSNRTCPTKHIRKLARSKYDRHSGDHVPRFDHHCPVLNKTVGEENYRFFLFFLIVHVKMCWYGSIVALQILGELVHNEEADISAILRSNLSLILLTTFLGLAGICLTAFLSFHFYLISVGMTTNEYYKWKSIRDVATPNGDEESLAWVSRKQDRSRRLNHLYNLGVVRNFGEVLHPRCQAHGRPKKRV